MPHQKHGVAMGASRCDNRNMDRLVLPLRSLFHIFS